MFEQTGTEVADRVSTIGTRSVPLLDIRALRALANASIGAADCSLGAPPDPVPHGAFDAAQLGSPSSERVAALDSIDLLDVDDHELVQTIGEWQRIARWAQARQAEALTEFAGRRPAEFGETPGAGGADRFAADEIAAALGTSMQAAATQLDVAVHVWQHLPRTRAAWLAGTVDGRGAGVIVDAVRVLSPKVGAAVEDRIFPRAEGQTLGQLRASVTRAVAQADPDGLTERHRAARADRRVELSAENDGMASLWALLPAPEAARLYETLSCLAHDSDDSRTGAQRRADALIDLAELRIDPTAKPRILVTVPASTLIGLDDRPGELLGLGPLSGEAARVVAADGVWRRLLTDPATGTVTDVGRTSYRPPAALADLVRTRDGTCRFPGCRRSATRADLDHTIPFPRGVTATSNLAALCRRHHLLKHDGSWSVVNDDGVLHWLSPHATTYRTNPDDAYVDPTLADQGGATQNHTDQNHADQNHAGHPHERPPPF